MFMIFCVADIGETTVSTLRAISGRALAVGQYLGPIKEEDVFPRELFQLNALPIDEKEFEMRTSASHPLQIAAVQPFNGSGLIGMTFCPGKKQPFAATGAWSRDLDVDIRAIENWNAAVVVTLVDDHELNTLKVPRLGEAVNPFAGSTDPQTAGNGSLMRLSPVAVRHWQNRPLMRDVAARQSRTTHAAPEAVDACVA